MLGAIIGGVAGLAGSWLQNRSNKREAARNRNWQAQMSNTSWQRAVADMEKAGINPALAYSQGGASTPGGATAAPQENVISSALQQSRFKTELDILKNQEKESHWRAQHAKSDWHTQYGVKADWLGDGTNRNFAENMMLWQLKNLVANNRSVGNRNRLTGIAAEVGETLADSFMGPFSGAVGKAGEGLSSARQIPGTVKAWIEAFKAYGRSENSAALARYRGRRGPTRRRR